MAKSRLMDRNKKITIDVLNGDSRRIVAERHGVSQTKVREIEAMMLDKAGYTDGGGVSYLRYHKTEIIPMVEAVSG